MYHAFDFPDYRSRFMQTARTLLRSGRTAADISGGMHLLTTAVERDLARFSDPGELAAVACGPGCGSCCVLNVNVLIPEAIAIARYLRRHFAGEVLVETSQRLAELVASTRWLDEEERLFLRRSCAFLDDDGVCMIHEVRPLLCRSITSADADACRDAVAMAPLEGAPTVPMNLFHKRLVDTAYHGLALALGELGLDDRPQRLAEAVFRHLHDPYAVTSFMVGKEVTCH